METKSQFQIELEEQIEVAEQVVRKLENQANVTRDFVSGVAFHKELMHFKREIPKLKAALEAYVKAGAK